MKFYQHWIGDYQGATRRLSLLEHGAYRLLLDEYYSTEGPLPANEMQLHRICMAFADDEKAAVHTVLHQFFTLTERGWEHYRVESELDRCREVSVKRKRAGVAGAAAKWENGGKSAGQTRAERLTNARRLARHTPEEWRALLLVVGNKCLRCGSDSPVVKDHILPIYQGGSDGIENIQPLCGSCNSSKGSESVDYRPSGWLSAWQNALQTPAYPQPQPQIESINPHTAHAQSEIISRLKSVYLEHIGLASIPPLEKFSEWLAAGKTYEQIRDAITAAGGYPPPSRARLVIEFIDKPFTDKPRRTSGGNGHGAGRKHPTTHAERIAAADHAQGARILDDAY